MSASSDQEDVVRLTVAANPLQAKLLQQALEEKGIQCMVVGEYLGELFGGGSGSFVELWVHREDLPRAEAVVAEHHEGEQPAE